MLRLPSRAARRPLALRAVGALGALATLAACADDPTPTAPTPRAAPLPNVAALGVYDTIMVTNASGGTGTGSLRWAVAQSTGGEIIRFAASLDGATITVDTTVRAFSFVTIEGPRNKGVTISGGDKVRVLHLFEGAHLRNLTIANGNHPEAGGGIFAETAVELENSTVRDNVSGTGGGIWGEQVTLINSTVARNLSSGAASGISYANRGGLALINSTVTGNYPAVGIQARATSGVPIVYLKNSIIARNGLPLQNCVGVTAIPTYLTYEGTNIADDASCGDAGVVRIADPKLGVLADRGGPSMTVDFAPQSPALNTGLLCSPPHDQRYVPRGAKCDVGAFEFTDFTRVTLTIDPTTRVDAATGQARLTGTITCTRDDAFRLALELHQDQKSGKNVVDVHAASDVPVTCTTTARPWSATMGLTEGAFQPGAARATAQTLNTPEWVTPAGAAGAVKISVVRK